LSLQYAKHYFNKPIKKTKRRTVERPFVFQAARPTHAYNIKAVMKETKPETWTKDIDYAIRTR